MIKFLIYVTILVASVSYKLGAQEVKPLKFPLLDGKVVKPNPYLSINEKNGIYIKKSISSVVLACDSGEVCSIVKHENLYSISVLSSSGLMTTYSNLDSVSVEKCQKLELGSTLGRLGNDLPLFFSAKRNNNFVYVYDLLIYSDKIE